MDREKLNKLKKSDVWLAFNMLFGLLVLFILMMPPFLLMGLDEHISSYELKLFTVWDIVSVISIIYSVLYILSIILSFYVEFLALHIWFIPTLVLEHIVKHNEEKDKQNKISMQEKERQKKKELREAHLAYLRNNREYDIELQKLFMETYLCGRKYFKNPILEQEQLLTTTKDFGNTNLADRLDKCKNDLCQRGLKWDEWYFIKKYPDVYATLKYKPASINSDKTIYKMFLRVSPNGINDYMESLLSKDSDVCEVKH